MTQIRLAVTVIAYPAISGKYGETVCVAGLRTDQVFSTEWIRLFPFKVRGALTTAVHKWDEIEIDAQPHRSDHRPESWRPNLNSIRVVGSLTTKRTWQSRRGLTDQLDVFSSMSDVLTAQRTTGLSLSAVSPGEILDLEITPKSRSEVAELEHRFAIFAAQGDLFSISEPTTPLEVVPFDFHFVVRYPGEDEPRRLKLVDWEIANTWRRWRREYDNPLERIRSRWLDEMCGPHRAPLFFVGNMHRFPQQFLLLNVYSPPRR